ncbi:MAG: tetratricopeptide repeat protein [Desulfomonilaceae bacterium]
MSRKHSTLIILGLLILLNATAASPSVADQTTASLLKQVRAEADPAKRIELLDLALKDSSLKGDTLASVFFERAMAYKTMNDCFRAIEDLDASLAHSRKAALPVLLEKAHCLILVDQLDEAVRVLETVLLTAPDTARAYVLKGMIYEKESFLSKAEDEYTRALDHDSESISALDMRARLLLREGKPRKALDDMNALGRLAPKDPDVFMTRARIHVKLKDYGAALADYARVESLTPGDDRVLKEKVPVFFEMDQPQKALAALTVYGSKHPDDVEVLVLEARTHILLKAYKKAEQILKRARAKRPLYAPAYLYMGVVLARNQDPDHALENLNRAIDLDPTLVEAHKERARTFTELGDPVRAAADLTAAAELDPADGEIFAFRGLTLIQRRLYDAAIADFTRALECLPGDPRIMYDRAVTFLCQDEPELALADLDSLLRVKPDTARALSLRGIVYLDSGNSTKAREDFDKAAIINPQDPQVWNNRGFFNYKTGNNKAAIEDFNRALKLNPAYDNARYNLGLALNKQESSDKSPATASRIDTPPIPHD